LKKIFLSLRQFARFFCASDSDKGKEKHELVELISGRAWKNPLLFTTPSRMRLASNNEIKPASGSVVDSGPSSYFEYLKVICSLHRAYFGIVELQLLNNR